jgi:hypothetical protein
MLTTVTRGLFVAAVVSLLLAVSTNRPGPAYVSLVAGGLTLVLLLFWSKLARLQPATRSTSNHTTSPSDSSP